MKTVYKWLNSIQQVVFPPTCILCGNRGTQTMDLCQSCLLHLPQNNSHCRCCAEILEPSQSDNLLCGRCINNPPAFRQVHAPFRYQDALPYLITGLKFGNQLKNARLLGLLLADTLQDLPIKPDVLIPVPLHPARYRERGFNQSLEIAKIVASQLHIPIDHRNCIRHRDTPHQTGLTAKKRRENLRRAFNVASSFHVHYAVIVDDVMTTGATANALALALKKAGVEQVDVWVCARA
jgi:ComF family protein